MIPSKKVLTKWRQEALVDMHICNKDTLAYPTYGVNHLHHVIELTQELIDQHLIKEALAKGEKCLNQQKT